MDSENLEMATLIDFFGAGWYNPQNRRTVAGARALATAVTLGARGPKMISRESGFREFERGGGTYTTMWRVGFANPPPDGEIKTSAGMPCDALFGRGDSRASARVVAGVLEIYAEQ